MYQSTTRDTGQRGGDWANAGGSAGGADGSARDNRIAHGRGGTAARAGADARGHTHYTRRVECRGTTPTRANVLTASGYRHAYL